MVFPSYAIWLHMTVFNNVAYGLRVRRLGKQDIAEKVHWALGLVRMGELDQRSAAQVRISHRVFLGDFVQYLVEWAGHQLVVRPPPTEHIDEGEQVYLGIAPEYCVLIEA